MYKLTHNELIQLWFKPKKDDLWNIFLYEKSHFVYRIEWWDWESHPPYPQFTIWNLWCYFYPNSFSDYQLLISLSLSDWEQSKIF